MANVCHRYGIPLWAMDEPGLVGWFIRLGKWEIDSELPLPLRHTAREWAAIARGSLWKMDEVSGRFYPAYSVPDTDNIGEVWPTRWKGAASRYWRVPGTTEPLPPLEPSEVPPWRRAVHGSPDQPPTGRPAGNARRWDTKVERYADGPQVLKRVAPTQELPRKVRNTPPLQEPPACTVNGIRAADNPWDERWLNPVDRAAYRAARQWEAGEERRADAEWFDNRTIRAPAVAPTPKTRLDKREREALNRRNRE